MLTSAQAQRVVVVGTSGSGKTTLAQALGARLGHPVVELDALWWAPNWTNKPVAEFRRLVDAATAGPRWVVDGNYAQSRDIVWPRATAIVWLNYSLPVMVTRVLWRTVRRTALGTELWHGNRESVRRSFFSRESILLWVATTYRTRRIQLAALRDSGQYANLTWIELRKPWQADRLLQATAAVGTSAA